MKHKRVSLMLAACLAAAMLAGCGSAGSSSSGSDSSQTNAESKEASSSASSQSASQEAASSSSATSEDGSDDATVYMAMNLPQWAEDAHLAQQDVTFTVTADGYQNDLDAAQESTGTYEYDKKTGVYTLDSGASLRESSDGAIYTNGDTKIWLEPYEENKTVVCEVKGSTQIEVPGGYKLDLGMTIDLYESGTCELFNSATQDSFTGTWTADADGSYIVTGDDGQYTTTAHSVDADGTQHISIDGSLMGFAFSSDMSSAQ